MDFYQMMFGRPSPGKRRMQEAFRYANSGEDRPEVERSDTGEFLRRREMEERARLGARGGYGERSPTGARALRVPLSQMTGVDRNGRVEQRPYGDDFVSWEAETRSSNLPNYMRDEGGAGPSATGGHDPRSSRFAPPDAEFRLDPEYVATREPVVYGAEYPYRNIDMGVDPETGQNVVVGRRLGEMRDLQTGRIVTESTSGPAPDAPESVRQPMRPERGSIWHGSEFWGEWRQAETRARERWQEGKPTVWDMMFTAIYGRRDRLDELQEDTEQMRQAVRNPRD